MHVSRFLTDLLDPVLAGTPFAPGQGGPPPDAPDLTVPWERQDGSVIWCAPYDAFRAEYPWLPQAHDDDQDEDAQVTCVDLTVEVTAGRLTRLDLEGPTLGETFLALDRPDEAATAARLVGMPLGMAGRDLATLVENLLRSP